MDLKFRFNLWRIQVEHLGLWYVEVRIDSWTSCISEIQDTISPVQNYLRNERLQKKMDLVPQSWSNPAPRKLVRGNSGVLRIQCATQKKSFLPGKGSGRKFPACQSFSGECHEAGISKLLMRLVRHYDQDEREISGAVHWNTMGPKLLKASEKSQEARKYSEKDWLQHIYERSNKTRFQHCESSKNPCCIFAQFKDTLVGTR